MDAESYQKGKLIFDSLHTLDDDTLLRLKDFIKDLEHQRKVENLIGKIFFHDFCTGAVYYICTEVSSSGRMSGLFFKPESDNTVTIGNYYGTFPPESKLLEEPFPDKIVKAVNLIKTFSKSAPLFMDLLN